MIRPFRLFATLAATLALALGVTTRLVRAEPEAPPPAVAYKGAVPVHARAGDSGEYQLERLPILSRVILQVKDNYVEPAGSTRSRWWSPRSRRWRRPSPR